MMIKHLFALLICALVLGPSTLSAFPSVYPTGTTIYKPDKAWNGYTIHQHSQGAVLIDMNGNVLKQWRELFGGGGSGPDRILPGGFVMGSRGPRGAPHQDVIELVQLDWDGKVVWKFDRAEEIKDPGKEPLWMARQHQDYQREGNPVGYYVPGMNPSVDKGNTLILSHKNLSNPKITDKLLVDDVILEVTWHGKIVWEWLLCDHLDAH